MPVPLAFRKGITCCHIVNTLRDKPCTRTLLKIGDLGCAGKELNQSFVYEFFRDKFLKTYIVDFPKYKLFLQAFHAHGHKYHNY